MAQVVIVYATQYGQTEKIAGRMAKTLRENGHGVELVNAARLPARLDLRRFDFAFVGSPVHAGRYAAVASKFVRQHRPLLERIPSAFFSVSLAVASQTSDGRAQMKPIIEKLTLETGWHPARVELIAGALAYSKYNWLIRLVMRSIAKKEGGEVDTSRDYEYTDWAAVDRFALEFVRTSAVKSAPAPMASL